MRPNLSGVRINGNVTTEVWDESAEDWTTPAPTVKMRPAGRVLVPAAGEYRITANLLPDAPVPDAITEAVGRVFALREVARPPETSTSRRRRSTWRRPSSAPGPRKS